MTTTTRGPMEEWVEERMNVLLSMHYDEEVREVLRDKAREIDARIAQLEADKAALAEVVRRFVLFERGELADEFPFKHRESSGATEAWLDRVLRKPAAEALARMKGEA